jgi:transposase-like protein
VNDNRYHSIIKKQNTALFFTCSAGSEGECRCIHVWDQKNSCRDIHARQNFEKSLSYLLINTYPAEIRRTIYNTTNAIESLNNSLKKIIKNRASFPNNEAAVKLLYLSLKNIMKKWTMPVRDWGKALNQFTILYNDRMPSS